MVKLVFISMVGVIFWPVLEYCIHRFLGHEWMLKTPFRTEHQKHHSVKDFFAPASYKAATAVLVVSILTFLGSFFVGALNTFVFVTSFVAMYLFYEWTHYSFHAYAPKTKLGASLRRHHFSHHFHNAKFNYGVTSTVFDSVFKTYKESKKVRVPKMFAMRWLFDSNGKLKSEFSDDYEVSS